MLYCPQCKHRVLQDDIFCTDCGQRLPLQQELSCPRCDHSLPHSGRICAYCGWREELEPTEQTPGEALRQLMVQYPGLECNEAQLARALSELGAWVSESSVWQNMLRSGLINILKEQQQCSVEQIDTLATRLSQETGLPLSRTTAAVADWAYALHLLGDDALRAQDEQECRVTYEQAKEAYLSQDYSEALELFRRAARLRYSSALNGLGLCYLEGRGVATDEEAAFYFFQEASRLGSIRSLVNVGKCWELGKGTERDYLQAQSWYAKAYAQGVTACQKDLERVRAHISASRPEKDYLQGKELLELGSFDAALLKLSEAMEVGYLPAINAVGACYYRGTGVVRDYARAFKLFDKAAKEAHPSAVYNVGLCYYFGQGVKQDLEKAHRYFTQAGRLGIGNAEAMVKKLQLS